MKKNQKELSAMSHNVWYVNIAKEVVSLRSALRRDCSGFVFRTLNNRLRVLLLEIETRGYTYRFTMDGFFMVYSPFGRLLVKVRSFTLDGVDSIELYLVSEVSHV